MNDDALTREVWKQIAFQAGLDAENGLLSKCDAALRQEIADCRELLEHRQLDSNCQTCKRIDAKLAEPTP